MQDEDAKRPTASMTASSRAKSDRQPNEAALVRLGIRGFNPKLKRATRALTACTRLRRANPAQRTG